MLELLSHLEPADELRPKLLAAVARTMEALMGAYSTQGQPEAEGLIDHGSYYVRGNLGLDGYMIWGDYYYLEALMRLERGIPGYWYERQV
ncbi:Unsaturated glucuronyl hydrolase [compost metagenome]